MPIPLRSSLVLAALLLLALAFFRTVPVGAQSAVPLSRPGQEDLSFWVNHNGLIDLDVEGEVGFGDMARLLQRRRANAEKIRPLRDRFTYAVRDFAALDTPDLFRAEIHDGQVVWRQKPERVVVGAGRIANIPVVVSNPGGGSVPLRLGLGDRTVEATIGPKMAAGYFLKAVERTPGTVTRRVSVNGAAAEFAVDVRAMVPLHVRLLDDGGAPVAARVYLTGADGLGYAPRGSVSRFAAMPAEQFFHAEGEFRIELPAGRTVIEAARGTEYELARVDTELVAGKPAEVTVRMRRWANMARRGWYSSDAHIHANYTAEDHQVITTKDVLMQVLGEDLNNANMMVANSSGAFLHDEALFEGKPHAMSRPDYVIYWNEEMRNSGVYGHMCLFNLKTLVRPIYTGFAKSPNWEDYPPNYTQAAAAQAQGGAVTYAHPGYAAEFERASAKELPVDLALGKIDAMDVLSNNPEEVGMELWYRMLNCGFRLAISAGTDAFTNVADHYIAGGGRVYVQVDGGAMNYGRWIEGYKRGRSFASNGPVISFSVDGKLPGDELAIPADGPRQHKVVAKVESGVPIDTVEVIVNGRPVVTRQSNHQQSIELAETITLDRGAWVALRVRGPWHRLVLNDTAVFAHTSPVYVTYGGKGANSREDAKFWVSWIESLIARVDRQGRFATPEKKEEVKQLFRKALEIYRLKSERG